jgi:subtilisin-like proprotein convertase family protein
LVVSATNTISDLDVSVDISHTFIGDLVVTLTHIDTGTSVIHHRPPWVDQRYYWLQLR